MPNILTRVKRVNVLYLILIVFYVGATFAIGWFDLLAFLPEDASFVMGEVLVGLPVLAYCLIFREKPFGGAFRETLRLPVVFLLILLGLASMPTAWFINSLTILFTPNQVAGVVAEVQIRSFWVGLFYIAVLPAVVEELIFRGIFYDAYRRVNPIRGMLLSGLLFGLTHLNLNQIAYAVPLGILLAATLELTGSFLAPMVVHFTINGFNVGLSWLVMRSLSDVGWEEALPETGAAMEAAEVGFPLVVYVILFVLALLSLAAVVGLLIAISALCRRKSWRKALFGGRAPVLLSVDDVPVKRRLGNVFLWLGVAVAAVFSLI